MYIWTMIGELVSGSIAHPLAVTQRLPALNPVVTASIEPKGSLLSTVTTRQPSWRLNPGPALIA
jgi:hypothetical protein